MLGFEATLTAVTHLPLVGIRRGKHAIRWPVLVVRFAVYVLIVGAGVTLVTWTSDWIFKQDDRGKVLRLVSISLFLAILFVVHDVRRDLKSPLKGLPDLDRGSGSEVE